MSADITRRAFLKTIMAVGLPFFVPVTLGAMVVTIEEVWLDEELFEGAFQVTSVTKGEVLATIDLKQAFEAVRCMDDEGRIWLLETEGDPNDCGGLSVTALTCGDMRIEVPA